MTSDGQHASCTYRNDDDPALVDRINDADSKIIDYETKLAAAANRQGTGRVYVGNTTATSYGNLHALDYRADNSLAAAAKVCADQYGAGARMCIVQDIYLSAVRGTISSTKNIAKAWVYAPSWNNPTAGGPSRAAVHHERRRRRSACAAWGRGRWAAGRPQRRG